MEKEKNISKKKSATKKVEVINEIPVSSLEGKFLLVKVGDNDKPASDDDIKDINDKLLKLFADNNVNCTTFVTHHRINMIVI